MAPFEWVNSLKPPLVTIVLVIAASIGFFTGQKLRLCQPLNAGADIPRFTKL
jgi:hypothetical protein